MTKNLRRPSALSSSTSRSSVASVIRGPEGHPVSHNAGNTAGGATIDSADEAEALQAPELLTDGDGD